MFVAMIAATRGTHAVADAPIAVIIAVRLVIAASVANAAFNSDAGYGAPAGSATTASIPPWRSTRGSTKTRPPIAATLAAVSAAFSTRTKFSQ